MMQTQRTCWAGGPLLLNPEKRGNDAPPRLLLERRLAARSPHTPHLQDTPCTRSCVCLLQGAGKDLQDTKSARAWLPPNPAQVGRSVTGAPRRGERHPQRRSSTERRQVGEITQWSTEPPHSAQRRCQPTAARTCTLEKRYERKAAGRPRGSTKSRNRAKRECTRRGREYFDGPCTPLPAAAWQ